MHGTVFSILPSPGVFCRTIVFGYTLLIFGSALSPSHRVRVWDNAVSESSRQSLHDAALKIGSAHKIFKRPAGNDKASANVIEKALDAILSEIDGAASQVDQYVEYWTRQEWRSIEAHADVDENLAKFQDAAGTPVQETGASYRYPVHGHVLYLNVGTKVRGPTCIFPERKTGGELIRPVDNALGGSPKKSLRGEKVELVTVPAVPGRVLQFEGSALHAVPRPVDLWFLSFEEGSPLYTPEEEWGRSVILFNTWHGKPPEDVPFDEQSDATTMDAGKPCNPYAEWMQAFDLAGSAEDEEAVCEDMALTAKIWLLGNLRRRDHLMRNVKLSGPPHLRKALEEEKKVSRIVLETI